MATKFFQHFLENFSGRGIVVDHQNLGPGLDGIANLFWFAGTPLYPGHAALDAAWGTAPLQDQANAGTVMMVTHCILAFGTIMVLFFADAREQGLQQRLIEAGLDRRAEPASTWFFAGFLPRSS